MCTLHLHPQALQSAQLELLHGPLGLSHVLRDFTNALLLDETLKDNHPLTRGQLFHQTEKSREILRRFDIRVDGWLGRVSGSAISREERLD